MATSRPQFTGAQMDDDPPDEPDLVAGFEREIEDRKWLKAIVPVLQLRSHDRDPSGRVQLALDLVHIEACERIRRILRSDLEINDGCS